MKKLILSLTSIGILFGSVAAMADCPDGNCPTCPTCQEVNIS